MMIALTTLEQALADTPTTLFVLDADCRLVAVAPTQAELWQAHAIDLPAALAQLADGLGDTKLAADVADAIDSQTAHARIVRLPTGMHRRRILPGGGERTATGVTLVYEKLRQDPPTTGSTDIVLEPFWTDMMHDLKTPLAAMVLWQQLITPELATLNDACRKALTCLTQSAEEISTLLEERSRVVKLLSGRTEFHFRVASWSECVRQAVDRARPQAADKGVELEMTIGVNDNHEFDASQVAWGLDVLLNNAVKYTPAGGWVRVGLSRDSGQIVVTVADSGIGLTAENAAAVFDPLRRTSDPEGEFGSGVNLAAVRCVAQSHGGTLSVVSAGLGQGCAFRLCLPVTRPGSAEGKSGPTGG